MRSKDGVVIVGAGAAGATAATELRRVGYSGPLTIVSGEDDAPYNRTTVNKGLLQGTMELGSVRLSIPTDDATRIIRAVATSIDTEARKVEIDDGPVIAYDALLVANGACDRGLPFPVADEVAHRVIPLRTAADARELRNQLTMAAASTARPVRVAIIGGGLIGAESADSLADAGHSITLVDHDSLPLKGVMGDRAAAWIRRRSRERMQMRLGVRVDGVNARSDGSIVVIIGEDARIVSDVVVYALGVQPDVAWLTDTPLDVTDGVLVDERLRAVGADGVYAAGDVARLAGSATAAGRFEHWGHALAHGTHAARVIAADLGFGDDPGAFKATQSFATRLHGRAITVLGTRTDRETVVRGDPANDEFVVAFTDAGGHLSGAIVVGPMKVANKVRPFVNDAAPVIELAAFFGEASGR